MEEPKTKPTDVPVTEFIDSLPDEKVRRDCWTIIELMQEVSQASPIMWGPSIVGFGQYHMVYASGRVIDWPLIGFSPRKQALTLYLNLHLTGPESVEGLLERLGKHKLGKGCLYIKRLSDVDTDILKQLIQASYLYTLKITSVDQPK